MIRRLLLSTIAALALGASFPTSLAAGNPHTLLCLTPTQGEVNILIQRGGWKVAEAHCLNFWHGVVLGITK